MSSQNFRLKCRNTKCGYEGLRRYSKIEFDELQYSGSGGISCFQCGFPKMAVMRSMQTVKDGFIPGFQRNIRKVCHTYSQYKEELKKMGLIELGYEDLPESEDGKTNYWTDDVLKNVVDSGVYLSGREAQALKEGKIDSM